MFQFLLPISAGLTLFAVSACATANHPVFDPGVTVEDRPSLEQGLQKLLKASDDELELLVPERNGLLFCGCPNCDGGSQDGQMIWLGWEDPDRIKCQFCEMVFPNDEYPENETIVALNPGMSE